MTIQVFQNVLRFLERVDPKGIAETYALTEAHQFIQKELERLAQAHVGAKIEEGVKAALASIGEKEPSNAQ